MTRIRVVRKRDGALSLRGLPDPVVALLQDVDALLSAPPSPAVERRLFPRPVDDDAQAAEWSRLVRPELFALLASSREVVARDLANRLEDDGDDHRVDIPAAHVAAWIHALGAVRLAIAERHGIGRTEMDPDTDRSDLPPAKRAAASRIDVYGWLQALLVDAQGGAG